jgi:DNA-binding transcriptional regulator YdaS (Cro superfamily)
MDASLLIEKAIRLAGSEAKLAAAVHVSQPAINKAKKVGRVTAEMAVAIERATGGEISRGELRPDLWPANLEAAPAHPSAAAAAESESPSLAQRTREALTQQLDDSRARLVRQRVQGSSAEVGARPAEHPYDDEDGAA